MGHIGLTPQTVSKLGGFKVQGTDTATARKFVEDALALEAAGIFMLTIQCVPDRLAEFISKKATIPVTGIGSGPYTDGQTLNLYDLVGLFDKFTPKFVIIYANLSQEILKALQNFKEEVGKGVFPGAEHSFHMKDEVLKEVLEGKGERSLS
jgi:3-methyl-2-oxobutanoate hydroxymethyltransferase